jgi:hypothetical protein
MDHLHRLRSWLPGVCVALLLAGLSSMASAAGYWVYHADSGATGTSASGLCGAELARTHPGEGGSPNVPANGGECDGIGLKHDANDNPYNAYITGIWRSCSDGSGTCVDAPQPHACGAAGSTISHPSSEVSQMPDGTAPTAVCDNGCTAVPAHVVTNTMGNTYSYGDTIATGHACGANAAAGGKGPADPASGADPSSAPDSTPAPTDAAKCVQGGLCPGTVNGTTVCVACGSSGTGGASSTTATSASGVQSSSTTTSSTSTSSTGTTTSTSTTTNSDGSTSTTVTSGTGGSSGGGGTGSGGGPCTGTDCGDDDSFGGSCAAVFTCTGDAVQCAIVKEQHERNCYWFQPETRPGPWADGAAKLSTALSDGDDPTWSPAHKGNETTNNFDWQSTIDRSTNFAASCPSGVSFTFAGQTVPLTFDGLCSNAQMLSNFFVAVTAIFCGFILFKRGS